MIMMRRKPGLVALMLGLLGVGIGLLIGIQF